MSNFAKLYERDGKQILVMKDEDDDGNAALSFTFLTDLTESRACVKMGFKPKEGKDEWEVLDIAFDATTEEKAFDIRENTPGKEM